MKWTDFDLIYIIQRRIMALEQFIDILMIYILTHNPEIGLRVVPGDIGSTDTLSVMMTTSMQYTLSTWSLLLGMNRSSCGLWHRGPSDSRKSWC